MAESRYFRVSPKFWADSQSWTEDARTVALYLLTCEHRNTEGLFRLPEMYAIEDLGWEPERFRDAFGELITRGFVEHDPDAKVVFIVKAMKYQRPDNKNQALGAARRIAGLPRNRLESSFLAQLERLPEGVREAFTEGLPEGFGDPMPEPDTNPQARTRAPARTPNPVAPDKPARPPARQAKNEEHAALFTALVEVCGYEPPIPGPEGSKIGKCAKHLREIGASPDDVTARAQAYRKRWPDIDLTPTGLVSNWAQVASSRNGHHRAPPSPDACQQCGQGKTDHDDQLCKILAEAS